MKERLLASSKQTGRFCRDYWTRQNRTGKMLVAALGAVILATALLKAIPKQPEKLPQKPQTVIPVEAIRVRAGTRPDLITLPGIILADIDATLAAERAGRITAICAERGQAVTNGQILLQLDDRAARAAADAARATAEDAGRNVRRIEQLSGTGAVSQQTLDTARKTAALADAQLREAEAALSWCTVRAPASGVVNERFVEEGEYLLPGMKVFNLIAADPVRITFDVPERDIRPLQTGDEVSFQPGALSGRTFSGRVSYISAKAGEDNNAFRVELKTPNPEGELRPGMIVSVSYRKGILDNAVTLPLEAVIPQKGDLIVFTVRDGRAVRRLVQIGSILKDEALILSGIEDGDLVITRGNRMLSDGSLINLSE